MLLKRYVGLAIVLGMSGLLALAQQGSVEVKEQPDTSAAKPDNSNAASKPEPPELLPLPNLAKLTQLDKAYLDAFSILRNNNSCSRFYGGPPAIEALNRLTQQLTTGTFDKEIAVRMKGVTSTVTNYSTGLSFRLFEKAELNLNGPFYRSRIMPNDPWISDVGGFSANSREIRVTILLHELGHLIKTPGKNWVLPNDGNDPALSRENTARVVAVCRDEIKALSRVSFAEELLLAHTRPDSKTGPVGELSQATH